MVTRSFEEEREILTRGQEHSQTGLPAEKKANREAVFRMQLHQPNYEKQPWNAARQREEAPAKPGGFRTTDP